MRTDDYVRACLRVPVYVHARVSACVRAWRVGGCMCMCLSPTQGRMMINQMMLLMHLEAQLREQAVAAYSRAEDRDPTVRMQRLDDVLALNEQLNEVGSMLSTLLAVPLQGRTPTIAEGGSSAAGIYDLLYYIKTDRY